MRSNALNIALFLLAASACSDTDSSTEPGPFDPNVPPSTPTVTQVAPGFNAPEMAAQPSTTTPSPRVQISPASHAPFNAVAAKLPPGERLHYVTVPALSGLKPGARVDFLGVFPIEKKEEVVTDEGEPTSAEEPGFFVMTLLQNTSVIDVRQPSGGLLRAGVSVTFDELETLLLAATRGNLTAVVRAPQDVEVSTITKTTLREVLEDLEVIQEKRQIRRRRHGAKVGMGKILADERGLVLPSSEPAGVLTAGTQVDVFGTFEISGLVGEHVVTSLLQNVDVIAAGAGEVQLSVTVDEAKLLLLAQKRGQLTFALRNREDIEVSTISKKTLREVLEDLEVIQEKRQIRIRKKPRKKMKSEKMIEIIAGDRGVGGGQFLVGRTPPPRPVANTESYDNPGQNHWVATVDDRLSTFAADVDGGSFTVARRKLNEGLAPPADSVRPEEWVNYFTYDYPQPTDGPFGVSLEAAPSPFQTDGSYRLLRVGVQAKSIEAKERPPVHLTFLVDVSGSMSSDDKLGLAVKSLKYLVNSLQPEDTVALTTYAGRTETLLAPTTVAKKGYILDAINRLRSGGGTAMNDGLEAAYTLAGEAFVKGHENRVIVLSDGDANIGGTGVDDMLATIADGAKRGITMSTIGFGMGNYKDDAMEQLSNKGNGNYYYIDSFDEVRKVFGEQLNATLQTIARDVKLQVEFDPTAVKRYRLIGYENRDIADQDFRNDSVDAGEMGAGHSVTALYELEMVKPNATTVATVRIRHRNPDNTGPTYETTAVMRGGDMASTLAETSYSFRFAAAVAAFAEIARQSPYASHLNLDWVSEVATAAAAGKADRQELLELITRAKSLL